MIDPTENNELNIDSIMRFINPDINFPLRISRIDEDGNFEKLRECSKRVNEIFKECNFKREKMFYDSKLDELRKRVICPGEVKVF